MKQIILYLQCDKTMTPTIIWRLRTKESSNTQISLITMADEKRKRTPKYGVEIHIFNTRKLLVLFNRSTPIDCLHILLGGYKYLDIQGDGNC